MMEKQLPNSIQAERGVLGSILIDTEAMVEVEEILTSRDFYRDAHQTIYATMNKLYTKRIACDTLTLSDELEKENKLDEIGGYSYLIELTDCVPTSGNAVYYARIVASKAAHRRRINAASQIAVLSYEEAENAQQQSEQLIAQVDEHRHGSDFTSFADIMATCMNKVDLMQSEPGSIVGVPSGYHGIDKLTGGFQNSDLILLGARPGEGKTTLAQNVIYNTTITYDMRMAMFSLEMSKEQLGFRFISMDSRVDSQRLRLGQIDDERDEWAKITRSIGKLSDGRLWIDDTAGLDIDVLRSKARRLYAKQGFDMLVVDYLQLLHATIEGKRPANRVQEISEISGKLKQLARELNVPVLALAQLSRAAESHTVPQLSDLRESGSLEQDADIVMFLVKNEETPGYIEVVIAKQRNGPIGNVRLGFDKQHTRFFNVDEQGREV